MLTYETDITSFRQGEAVRDKEVDNEGEEEGSENVNSKLRCDNHDFEVVKDYRMCGLRASVV